MGRRLFLSAELPHSPCSMVRSSSKHPTLSGHTPTPTPTPCRYLLSRPGGVRDIASTYYKSTSTATSHDSASPRTYTTALLPSFNHSITFLLFRLYQSLVSLISFCRFFCRGTRVRLILPTLTSIWTCHFEVERSTAPAHPSSSLATYVSSCSF
jgi:hypothetical protein